MTGTKIFQFLKMYLDFLTKFYNCLLPWCYLYVGRVVYVSVTRVRKSVISLVFDKLSVEVFDKLGSGLRKLISSKFLTSC